MEKETGSYKQSMSNGDGDITYVAGGIRAGVTFLAAEPTRSAKPRGISRAAILAAPLLKQYKTPTLIPPATQANGDSPCSLS